MEQDLANKKGPGVDGAAEESAADALMLVAELREVGAYRPLEAMARTVSSHPGLMVEGALPVLAAASAVLVSARWLAGAMPQQAGGMTMMLLLYAILPAWSAVRVGDWVRNLRQRGDDTTRAGWRERLAPAGSMLGVQLTLLLALCAWLVLLDMTRGWLPEGIAHLLALLGQGAISMVWGYAVTGHVLEGRRPWRALGRGFRDSTVDALALPVRVFRAVTRRRSSDLAAGRIAVLPYLVMVWLGTVAGMAAVGLLASLSGLHELAAFRSVAVLVGATGMALGFDLGLGAATLNYLAVMVETRARLVGPDHGPAGLPAAEPAAP